MRSDIIWELGMTALTKTVTAIPKPTRVYEKTKMEKSVMGTWTTARIQKGGQDAA